MAKTTILLIDDDVDVCNVIFKLLAEHGIAVVISNNTNDLESILNRNRIDLVLLDILLPGGQDGIAVCKMIRQITNIPIIMLTGIETDIEKVVSLEVGADYYLTKPFNSRILLAHINASLRRQSYSAIDATQSENEKKNISVKLVEAEYHIWEFLGWRLNITSHTLLSPKKKCCQINLC